MGSMLEEASPLQDELSLFASINNLCRSESRCFWRGELGRFSLSGAES
jgi:hypothetical protein